MSPYITQDKRKDLNPPLEILIAVLRFLKFRKGVVNHVITRLLLAYVKYHSKDYDSLSDVKGVLDDVKDEFYRRVTVPYEEKKRKLHGDVYEEE